MSKFITELKIKCCETNENLWQLEAPLVYESDLLVLVTVPAGFWTDLASTRHIPLVSFIWGNSCHREAVIHDALYRIDSDPVISFSLANSVFMEAMEARCKGFFTRWPMYFGVFIGGYFSYHKKKMDWKPSDKASCEPPDPTDSELVKI